jgi:flagellar assembly protein FliH
MSSKILRGRNAGFAMAMKWSEAPPAEEPLREEIWPPEASAAGEEAGGGLAAVSTATLENRIRELEAEVARRHELGRREGYAAGEQAGAQSGDQKWAAAQERLARAVAELATYRARFRKQSEQELLRLSLAIARKVLHRELTVDPQALLGVIKAALEAMNQSEILRVRVAAEDVSGLQFHIDAMGLPAGVEVTGDRSLERGSVLIDTHRGVTDASLHTQLREIERGFIDRMDAA